MVCNVLLRKWIGEHANEMGSHLAAKLATCESVDVLTGYFFFDGFQGLADSLEKNKNLKLRILVGMDAGIDTRGLVYSVYEHESAQATEAHAAADYLAKLKLLLSHADPKEFVSPEKAKLSKLFSAMVSEGRLQIRKTKFPNHAKLYIFHKDGAISYSVGSSNFSHSGLNGRHELNAQISGDAHNAQWLAAEFERFWNEALPITEFAEHKGTSEKATSVAAEIATTLVADAPTTAIAPFVAYMKVMREYLKLNRSDNRLEFRIRSALRDAHFDELKYQIDAVSRAKRILDTNGGVIIADVVGLGKSVVGTLLAKLSDGPGVVLAPPHLVDGDSGWKGYLTKFGLDGSAGWKALSIYATDLATDPAVRNAATVIIDEAHNIRNTKTGLYESVSAIVVGKKVVCLTATPFNNRPSDLGSLVSLFGGIKIAGETKSDFMGRLDALDKRYERLVTDRRQHPEGFDEEANRQGFAAVADELKMRLAPLMIRRNRLDLKNNPVYAAEIGVRVPSQRLVKKTFHLSTTQTNGDLYADVVGKYFGAADEQTPPEFSAGLYHPETFVGGANVTGQRQGNLANMVRRFLVMRWESSPAAFHATLKNVKNRLVSSVKMFEEEGVFLPSAGVDPVTGIIDDEGSGPVYVKTGVDVAAFAGREIRTFTDAHAAKFTAALKADGEVLEKVEAQFIAAGLNNPTSDGKLSSLIETIDSILSRAGAPRPPFGAFDPVNPRKVIVFSQYADTAKYVKDALAARYGDKVAYAEGGVTDKDKAELERHFRAKGEKAKTDEKLILVTTDVLSEGINLNQAGVVVNYDISWNPVRTIQRIGRINRIDKKVHDPIYAVNFFPAAEDAGVNNVEGISVRKMKMIHGILGEDAKVLSDDEEPRAFIANLTDLAAAEGNTACDETRIAALYEEGLKAKCGTDAEKRASFERELDALGFHFAKLNANGPVGVRALPSMYVFSRNASAFFAKRIDDIDDRGNPVRPVSCFEAIEAIKCDPSAPMEAMTESDPLMNAYNCVKLGLWAQPKSEKLTGMKKKAWDSLSGMPGALTARIKPLIGTDAILVEAILAAGGDVTKIAAAVEAAKARTSSVANENSVDVMVVGFLKGEGK